MSKSEDRRLEGKRVVVLGGSSGLGRAMGMAIHAAGARVAFAARRGEMVDAAAKSAGEGAIGLTCDVRDAADCARVVDEAVDQWGGLDGLVCTVAHGPLTKLVDADGDVWRQVFETNVVGPALVTRAAIPHLRASNGCAVYVSSVSGTHTAPWPGLGVYGVSKAALERMVAWWRVEHPDIRFGCLVVGPAAGDPSAPSEFGRTWDMDLAVELSATWIQLGLMDGTIIPTSDLCSQAINMLATSARLSTVVIEPHTR